MDIRITQKYAKIGIQTTNANLDLKNCGQTDFNMRHTDPKVQIHSTLPKIQIDQSACFADEGLKGIKDFMADVVQKGRQAAFNYIGKEAQEGDSYTQTQYGGRAILNAIKNDMYRTTDYNVAAMPQHRPDIRLQRGEVNINAIKGEINTSYNNIPVEGTYTPGGVNFYLLQKNSIDIEYIGKNVDTKV